MVVVGSYWEASPFLWSDWVVELSACYCDLWTWYTLGKHLLVFYINRCVDKSWVSHCEAVGWASVCGCWWVHPLASATKLIPHWDSNLDHAFTWWVHGRFRCERNNERIWCNSASQSVFSWTQFYLCSWQGCLLNCEARNWNGFHTIITGCVWVRPQVNRPNQLRWERSKKVGQFHSNRLWKACISSQRSKLEWQGIRGCDFTL